jgi:aflatoxin B1 aldehyde reductase
MESVELIFGGATIGTGNFSQVDAVEQLLSKLKELGITRIDTAARYAGGLSETMLGEAGAADKYGFTIDTKIMFAPPGNGTLTGQAISKSIETSLRRLKVEKVRTEA